MFGAFFESITMTNKLTIFGYAEGCPACDDLKSLLDLLNIPYTFHHTAPESHARASLRAEGYATLPQVFSPSGEALGGYSDFRKVARLGIQAAGLLS